MSRLREMVLEGHAVMGSPVLPSPQVPPDQRVRFRLKYHVEELFELIRACHGLPDKAMRYTEPSRERQLEFELDEIQGRLLVILEDLPLDVDMVKAARELADVAYICEGTNQEFGINSDQVLEEVHRANMRKAGGGKTPEGKWIKPKGWQPPRVDAVLRLQGWRPKEKEE